MFSFLPNLFNKLFTEAVKAATRRREARYAAYVAHRRQVRFVRPGLEDLEGRSVPNAYTFYGTISSDWANPDNWLDQNGRNGVPGSADTATIPSGKTCTVGSLETVAGLTVSGTLNDSGTLSVTTMTSTGTFNITPGGELDVMSSADFAGTGTINGRIDANASSVYFNGNMTLGTGTNLTGSGTFNVYGNIDVTGNISQNAVMVLGNNNTTPPISGSIGGTGSIDDSGEFDWNNGSIGLTGGVTFEANADLKIEGAGAKFLTTGTLKNQCNASDIGGTGTLTITGGATFDCVGNPTCDVTIPTIQTLGPTSSFINDADGFFDVQGATTISGSFTNLGTLNVPGSLTLTNPGGGDTINLDSHVQVDGTLTLLGNVSSPTGFIEDSGSGTLKVGDGTNAGTLTVAGGYDAVLSGLLEVTSTGTLNGGGQIDNNDKLQLDIGSTTDIGSYLGGNSGTLDLQASSATTFSSLTVAGSAALSGTLELDFLNGYKPSSGTQFVLLKASSISAHFDSTPPGMTTTYSPTTVTVTQN